MSALPSTQRCHKPVEPNAAQCSCRSQSQGKHITCRVLYYSHILSRASPAIDRLLYRKQARLDKLKVRMEMQLNRIGGSPETDLSEAEYRQMYTLQEEIEATVSVLMIVEQLHDAYLDETGTMASIYWKLWAQHEDQKNLVAELRRELERIREHGDAWFAMYQELKQKHRHV